MTTEPSNVPNYIRAAALRVEPVGSRVTCNPPPQGTDEDFLILLPERGATAAIGLLMDDGWTLDGSFIQDEVNRTSPEDRFTSYSLHGVNLIVTRSRQFYIKFMAASSVAKRLNLLDKHDRIALFQAVLYANPCDEKMPALLSPTSEIEF